MNTPCRCGTDPVPTSAARRWSTLGGWLLPSALLAVLPKCPMCLAAWLAVATGLGVSVTTAAYLRSGLSVLCVLSLASVSVRHLRRFVPR